MKNLFSTMLALTFVIGAANHSLASGSSGGGGYGGGTSNYRVEKKVDQSYERGKSIYKGRVESVGKIKYCVQTDEGLVKLRGKSLKPYKNGTYQDLASKLYDCETPDALIADTIGSNNISFVLYYLNKRHKLNLNDG